MDYETIRRIREAISVLSFHTKTEESEIIDALEGVAWDEEDAGTIKGRDPE